MNLREATARSSQVRGTRAALKRRLKSMGPVAARAEAAAIIANPPEDVGGMSLGDLLLALPYVGRGRAQPLVRGVREVQLERLTPREIRVLVERLHERRTPNR